MLLHLLLLRPVGRLPPRAVAGLVAGVPLVGVVPGGLAGEVPLLQVVHVGQVVAVLGASLAVHGTQIRAPLCSSCICPCTSSTARRHIRMWGLA